MIGSIKGKIVLKTEKFLVLETAGVGYKVSVSPETLSKSPKAGGREDLFLWTHLQVREDSLDLYGFLKREELQFFEMLLSVPGVGPKGALAILGIATLSNLRQAISTSDTSYLTKISGIGRKTAEKIVIELRDKVGNEKEGGSLQGELDAMEALKSLGYSQNEAREALKKVNTELDTNKKIKEALRILGGK